MRRFFETYVLQAIYVAIVSLIGWALVLTVQGNTEIQAQLEAASRPNRTDKATSPDWQPVPVTWGGSKHVILPTQVR